MALSNEINYNNERHYISIKLIDTSNAVSIDKVEPRDTINLPMDNVGKFEIITDLMNPIMTASFDFTDSSESYFDNYVGSTGNYVFIGINKFKDKTADTSVDQYDWTFTHLFIIDSIDITGRNNDTVNYQVKLKSTYWWNFLNSVPYSTSGELPTIDIIKNLLVNNGLDVGDVIRNYQSDERMKRFFITPAGESMYDSYKYLLEKLNMGWDIYNNGLSMIYYDHMNDVFDIWNSKITENIQQTSNSASDSIRININNNMLTTLLEQNDNKILLSNNKSVTDVTKRLRTLKYYNFDYDKNTFSNYDITNDMLVNNVFTNNEDNMTSKIIKIENFVTNDISTNKRVSISESSQSNEKHDHFEGVTGTLFGNNVITINVAGKFDRTVGQSIYLGVDLNKDAYSPLQSLLGWWVCLRVRHIFTASSYTSNVVLGRFTTVEDNNKNREEV
jgi:hypothetical protein